MLSTMQMQGFLDFIEDKTTTLTAAATTYANLLIALQAFTAANFFVSASSGAIISTSANGHSVTLSQSADGTAPSDYKDGIAFIRDTYRNARAALISAGAITALTAAATADPLIFAEIRYRLQSVREFGPSSYVDLRTLA